MIINIPLTIDEAHLEGALQHEYEKEAIKIIEKKINAVLMAKSGNAYYSYYSDEHKAKEGMEIIIQDRASLFLDENRDAILEIAGKELAKRLARTKRGKELLGEANNG